MKESLPHFLWHDRSVAKKFRSAVSLHSHTQHSREVLDFIPRYSKRVPVLSQAVGTQLEKYHRHYGKPLDFRRAWWTPPVTARQAFDLERAQIEQNLGLDAMVSLSDHDSIEAGTLLQVLRESNPIPVSVEWTVPYGESFFHIGVHNLPGQWAPQVMERLAAYTTDPAETRLSELFCLLHGFPSTLIVFNHPLWDEPGIGQGAHMAMVDRFLRGYREWIHALELNGLRSWKENNGVVQLAKRCGLPIVSGGDRHACEPNALVNLTNAATFCEFVSEVRNDGHSKVLFMDQYNEPLRLRLMQNLLDVVRDYKEHPEGRTRWSDRVFFRSDDGSVKPLSAIWEGDGPCVVKLFMGSLRLLESRRLRGALRFALAGREEVTT